MKWTNSRLLGAMLVGTGILIPVSADIIPGFQDRAVDASAFADDKDLFDSDSHTFTASDTMPVSVNFLADAMLTDIQGFGSASQESEITATMIHLAGRANGNGFVDAEFGFAGGDGSTRGLFEFTTDEARDYHLTGTAEATDDGTMSVFFGSGLEETFVDEFNSGSSTFITFDEVFTLPAGFYMIRFDATGAGSSDGVFETYGFAEVDITLQALTNCASDLNGDFVVDLSDLAILLGDFGCLSGCVGDTDGDGYTGLTDLAVLLSEFGMSC